MKKYRIKSEGEYFEVYGDNLEPNSDGHLELDILRDSNPELIGCFKNWDYFYEILKEDKECYIQSHFKQKEDKCLKEKIEDNYNEYRDHMELMKEIVDIYKKIESC